jgi:LIM domain kinase 1
MRSIRNPHLLTFYGAGVDSDSRAFLVTELMAGSLQSVLHDHARALPWDLRLQFADDITGGMRYLHEVNTIHRDLKSENCFVHSGAMRIKVADFGTSRISQVAERMHKQDDAAPRRQQGALSAGGPSTTRATGERSRRTLSNGVGTLMWLAPEALQGKKLSAEQAPALDVYSFAVVLWEIWARVEPWAEVQGAGIKFRSTLAELVIAGGRPKLPANCEPAPRGFQELMERCWVADPVRRPDFPAVASALAAIRGDRLSNANATTAV